MSHLLATPRGITLAGVILAKRNSDGSFAIKGNEKSIHAQLQAAYGRAVHPQAMRYVERGCELLAKVSDQELQHSAYPFHPNPHAKLTAGNEFSDLTKGLMMFALTGLNDMENISQGKVRLLKMQGSIHHDSLLKSYGLPTWAELTKDDGDDEDDDEDDDSDDADSGSESAGGGNSHYNPDEPRIPAGQPGGGQWTTGGNGVSSDSGSISADDVRTALRDDFDNYDPSALPQGTQVAGDNVVPVQSDATPEGVSYVPVTLNDDSMVIDPVTGKPILMPSNVSLQANVDFGETINGLPSYLIGAPGDTEDLSMRETAMIAAFMPGGAMDYQRIASDIKDTDGNALIDKNYIDFGNFNFGVVAAAAGYQLEQTVNIASLVNARNLLNPNVDTSDYLGGNPRNNYFIRMGYYAYTSGKITGTNKK